MLFRSPGVAKVDIFWPEKELRIRFNPDRIQQMNLDVGQVMNQIREARTLENLGVYDPASPKPELRLSLKVDRAKFWLSQGALPSETVRSIFKREGVSEGVERSAPRKRPGRKVVTKARAKRVARKTAFAEAKSARRIERVTARRTAAKAAAAEAAAEA